MAATQAEPQHKEAIREQVQQEQPVDVANSGLQNGTEKNGNRDNVSCKPKLAGPKSLTASLEMSQYRQESGAGPPSINSEQSGNSSDVDSGKLNSDNSGKPFAANSDAPGDPNYGKVSDNAAPGYPMGYPARGNYQHLDQHPAGTNNSEVHLPYGPQGMRHSFPGKPQAGGPMIPPRPPSAGPNSNSPSGPFPPHGQQQRFMSGQSISQPTGPTPTLNQLLQSSNPVHRYQNSYGEMNMQKPGEQGPAGYAYNQWPSSYPSQHIPQGYRNQSPYGGQQPYPDQRPSWGSPAPPGPGHPPGHPPGGHPPGHPPPGHPAGHPGPGHPPGHAPPPGHPASHPPGHPAGHPPPPHPPSPAPPPSSPGHLAGHQGNQGPHPSQTPSPHPQPSPQPPSPQHQSFSNRPSGEPTSNAHPPDAAVSNRVGSPRESTTPKPSDLTGQNSNDSSTGPAPGTPNSQGMRPTPSPTGSSGSRSMSPAVGQQNIPMPPRPSSVQSDGSGPTRMSLSPMATQGGYQQPLAPPPHIHGYKMGHPGMPPTMPPSSQQMPPYSPQQGQQYPQGGSYSPRPQGNMQYSPSQNYGPGAGGPQSNAYPSRPIPNHVPHSQFGYQGWGAPGPGMNQGPPPSMMAGPGPGNHVAGKSPNNGPPSGPPGPQGGPPGSASSSPQTPPPQGPPGPPGPPGPSSQPPGPPGPAASPGMSPHPGPRPHTPPHGHGSPHGPPLAGPHGPHYLKQHLQHKMGFGTSPSPGPPGGPPQGPPGGPPGPPPGPPGPQGPGQGPPQGYAGPGAPGPGGPPGGPGAPGPQGAGPQHGSPMGPPLGHHHPGPMGPPMSSSSPGPGGPPPGAPPGAPPPGAPSPVSNSHGPHPHHDGQGPPMGHGHPPGHPPGHPAGPMPPPASTPNSHAPHSSAPHSMADGEMVHDNGIITTAAGTATTNVSPATASQGAGQGGVTCVVTTGPDGAPMDEASQQSTLSNASAASGEESSSSKSRKDGPLGLYHNHPASAASPVGGGPGTVPSPGPSAMNSLHDDYEMGGPGGPGAGPGAPGTPAGPNNWPRTPASPVFNSHVGGPDPYRSKKPDSLGKLYDMDDSKERWMWLDKLLQFMEERGSPIQACPTISKNPLDLFRLYFYVKERGGFMEVTKNKTWKDIAGLLGIGASSSAAYTLRKHYTKNLLPYECHFDRGGIDPQPIINQVEAGTKKKPAKTAPVPSPGSSNSQDSFPPPGSGSTSMDGYSSYGYPPNAGPEYNAQRPPSQSNASSPHPGYQGQGGYQYPEQYNRGPEYNQQYPPGGNFPSNRPMYPPFGPEGDRPPYNQSPSSGQGGPPGTPGSDPYNRYQPPGYQPRPGYPPAPPSSPGTPQPPGQAGDYYRPDQPRRHPDFAKDQQPYQPFNQQRPAMYGGWPNNTQYRGQYPPQAGTQPNSQQWNQPPRPGAPPSNQASSGQWPQSPYQPPQNSQQPWGPNMPPSGVGQGSPLRPPLGPHAQYRPDGKPRPAMPGGPPPGMKLINSLQMPQPSQSPGTMGRMKSDSAFPLDSVEATTPVLYKRKRLMRADVCPVEAWRLMMSLRSGLLAESCWALDTLNILLFDDVSVAYFGLQHMPGLLDVLLEHFRKALDDMFESSPTGVIANRKWYEKSSIKDQDVDLGSVMEPIDPNDKTQILSSTMPNYTLVTRKGKPVRIVNRDSEVFILDTKKTWDVEGEASDSMVESEAAAEALATKYIVPCFQAEFHAVPFVRLIPDKISTGQSRPPSPKTEPQESDCSDSAPACKEEVQLSITEGCVSENTIEKKNCERKKRTKSLSDVLNRIKKEKEELLSATKQDALSRDLSASVNEQGGIQVKREDLGVGKANNNRSENSNALSKDSNMVIEENHVSESSKADGGESENKSDNSVPVTEVKLEPMDVDEAEKTAPAKARAAAEEVAVEEERPYIRIGDSESVVKRRRMSDYEDECYTRDEASLYLVTDTQDSIARRCVCLSNILRNLSFIPGNEMEFAKNPTFLGLLGKLMLIHHEHPLRTQRNYEREEDADCTDSCSSLSGDAEWWWDFLFQLRENVLVTMSNIAGQVDLGQYPEEVSRPLLDGLLHWAVCPAAHGQDPFPTVGPNSSLSPQRLALEALCKLCVMEANVDLVIATPPYSRLERLCAVLTKLLCRSEEQVLREFAVNLLHYLAAADSGMARTVALQGACVSQLVAFIEQAEQVALGVANQHGISALRDNPDAMGTSLDMLRRAAGTLLHLARHPDNRPLFLQQEQRLLALVMSQILDQQVAAVVSSVLFQCSRTPGPARPHPLPGNTTVAATAPS